MSQHKVLVLAEKACSPLGAHVVKFFDAKLVNDIDDIASCLMADAFKVIVYDTLATGTLVQSKVSRLLRMEETLDIPVVLLAQAGTLQEKIDTLEVGCDDFIDHTVTGDEACARITKSIFHRVAADQLSSRLEMANKTAHSAMIDNSDLGANIQFLLSVHDCDNLDQLGQLFFTTIERYGLKCSLQLRSSYEIKNMEAHGMAKDLESQLLSQLKDSDRYIDFGVRTIINYDRVSLLIKNMPVEEPDKYGAIKDNTFSLIQGMNARVKALEDHCHLLDERENLKKLSSDVRNVMSTIQGSYQKVMRDIAQEVDNASELISIKMPSFALTEDDEAFIEKTIENCICNTTRIFNEGLVVDGVIGRLEGTIVRALQAIDAQDEAMKAKSMLQSVNSDAPVELF